MDNVQGYIQLLSIAMMLGDEIYADVKASVHKVATPDELNAVLAQWNENEMRSARDAGLTPGG